MRIIFYICKSVNSDEVLHYSSASHLGLHCLSKLESEMMDEWIDGQMDGLFVLILYIPGLYIGHDARKPVFRVSDKARLKPDSSAKETRL